MFRLRALDPKSSEMLGNQSKVNKGNSNTLADHTPQTKEAANNYNYLSQGKGQTNLKCEPTLQIARVGLSLL